MFRIDRKLISYVGSIDNTITRPEEAASAFEAQMMEKRGHILAEARQEADKIISDANAKAALIGSQALSKADEVIAAATGQSGQIKEQARTQGYNDGLNQGLKQTREEAEAQRLKDEAELNKMIGLIQSDRTEILESLEGEVISLVIQAVEKIVKVKVTEDGEAISAMIHDAIKHLADPSKVSIRLSAGEYSRFFPEGAASFKIGNETINTTVVADPGFQSGDCIIETEGEAVNISVDRQLESIAAAFDEANRIA